MDSDVTRMPLRKRNGEVVAFALIDTTDADLVLGRGAWCLDDLGYVARYDRPNGVTKRTRLHRFLLGLDPGNPLQGDHINRDRLDNRRSNLRAVTQSLNTQNRAAKPGAASPFKGVSPVPSGRWKATGRKDNRQIHIGTYDSEVGAAEAAKAWRLANMPGAVD